MDIVSYALSKDNTLWCVEDGVLKRHSHITKVMVETENDFELLNDFPPGTVAFLAGYSRSWQKKADGTWAVIGDGSEPEPEPTRQLRTALYYNDDGSQYELIINEPIDGWRRDDPMFYQLIAEFPPLDDEHPYIFECDPENKSPNTYWFAYLGDINCVEIGSPIQPQSMANWFNGMSNLTDVSGLSLIESASLTDLSYMFYGCSSLSYAVMAISGLDTSAVENMDNMFAECNNLISITVGDGWSTESVTSSSGMFFNCTSLVGQNGTTYNSEHVDAEYARIDTQETPGYFTAHD